MMYKTRGDNMDFKLAEMDFALQKAISDFIDNQGETEAIEAVKLHLGSLLNKQYKVQEVK